MEDGKAQLDSVLHFWFKKVSTRQRFMSSLKLDQEITAQFGDLHRAIAANEYWKFRSNPDSFLAEVIVLDQFSRNMFRGTAEAFAHDAQALTLAQQAILAGYDTELPAKRRHFLYMPFMHSESREIHVEAVKLFESLGMKEALKYEQVHKDIIDRFGRYPHRNAALGRENTPEEVEYLHTTKENFF